MQAREHGHDGFAGEEGGLFFQHVLRFGVEVEPFDGAGGLIDHEAAQVERELRHHLLEVFAAREELGDDGEDALRVVRSDGVRHAVDPAVADEAEHLLHERGGHGAVGEGDALVEDGERVAQAAVRLQRDELERVVRRLRLHRVADGAQAPFDLADGDAAEIVALAAGLDGGGHLVRLGRREDEDDVGGRLLERLEERVERLRREHVHLVDDVDFVAALGGREFHRLAQAADLVDAAVRRRVDLEDVHRGAVGDLAAVVAGAARLWRRPVLAVERHGEDLRRARLACAARPREEVGVADAPRDDGLRERLGDMFLPDEVGEGLRPPFPIECDIRHASFLLRFYSLFCLRNLCVRRGDRGAR